MIDPKAAASLRKIFAKHVGDYPYLLPKAEIELQNNNGSKFIFKVTTPEEAAEVLLHLYNNDGSGIFNRMGEWDREKPLYFRMNKRIRLKTDNKEAVMRAFNFTFRNNREPAHLYVSDPEVNDYVYQGDDKIESPAPQTFQGPTLSDLISVLRRAEKSWQDVNFITPHKRPNLKVIPGKS